MQIHKITITVLDFDGLGAQEIVQIIENVRYIRPSVLNVETREIGEWDDDHPLNNASTKADEIQRIFSS